jgi:hypothetical protein
MTINTVLPLVTFCLGCLFALLVRQSDRRHKATEKAVSEICKLTKAWYAQVYSIFREISNEEWEKHQAHLASESKSEGCGTDAARLTDDKPEREDNRRDAASRMDDYLYSREILPDLLLNLGSLRRDPRCKKLAEAVDDFLRVVTYTVVKKRLLPGIPMPPHA